MSFDQQLGESVGTWIRFGWQDDKAGIDYQKLYSGGVNISGSLWRRNDDNIWGGYAYLGGGNQSIDSSQIFESYYRMVLNKIFSIKLDLQYLKDKLDNADSPSGFIYVIRMTAEFYV